MDMNNRYLKCAHQTVGPWGTVILMLPILVLVWFAAREPFLSVASGRVPYYILSGRLFSDRFDTIHAGSALDQPTIGKWLTWFSVMGLLSLPYAAMVRWITNRRNPTVYWAYTFALSILCAFLLCILSWPVCWLVQYMFSMGLTPRRACGLAYGIGGGILVIGFLSWGVRRSREL